MSSRFFATDPGHIKTNNNMKKATFTLFAAIATSAGFSSCSSPAGNMVAGAAVMKAVDEKEEKEKKEDLAWAKYHSDKKKR